LRRERWRWITAETDRNLLQHQGSDHGQGIKHRVDPPDQSGNHRGHHRFEFDGDYNLRVGMPGERGADAKPVKLNVWVDGKLVDSRDVATKPSGLVYFNPFSEEQLRIPVFRRRTRDSHRVC
jgi:hypothetical protein